MAGLRGCSRGPAHRAFVSQEFLQARLTRLIGFAQVSQPYGRDDSDDDHTDSDPNPDLSALREAVAFHLF